MTDTLNVGDIIVKNGPTKEQLKEASHYAKEQGWDDYVITSAGDVLKSSLFEENHETID